jgi:hypothetical protein
MFRQVLLFALLFNLLACKNDDKRKEGEEKENASYDLGGQFKEMKPPFALSDTGLLKNKDTTSLPSATLLPLIADSIKNTYFGKGAKIQLAALAKFVDKQSSYYLIKASAGTKKAALLMVYDLDNNYQASYPFLLPDSDPSTYQSSSIDKNMTITKNVIQRKGPDVTGEGKEVVAYDAAQKSFSLIMLDALNENFSEIISPIDTFPRTNKFAGDYYINKKNLVSVRDGRYPNQLLVYIHTENKEGDCKGELRGEFVMTTSSTAVYRQGGDPCVLNLVFKGNKVSISEETGCGNYRELDCPLTGTFTRKKPQSAKATPDKPKRK